MMFVKGVNVLSSTEAQLGRTEGSLPFFFSYQIVAVSIAWEMRLQGWILLAFTVNTPVNATKPDRTFYCTSRGVALVGG